MKKTLLIIIMLQTISSFVWGASVKAKVNDTNVIIGNSVNLTLEATGNDVKFPSIQTIGDYPVERISSMSKSAIKVINGQTTQEIVKQQTLVFTPDKDMTIPAFEIEVEGQKLSTESIDLKMVKDTAPTTLGSQKFNLAMNKNKESVYVGEPLLLSIYFSESRGADIMDFRAQQPDFKDFIVKEIEGEKTYRKDNYLVHEFRYLITPTREGNLTIDSIRAKVAERSQVRDNFFGTFFDKPKWSQIRSNSLNLLVKPLPQKSDMVGSFTIGEKIDAQSVKANKPVNLTITISGEGNLEEFEGLNYEIDGVTIYSDNATVESRVSGSQMMSSYKKKFVFISDQNFTIPSKSFSTFNPKTQKIEELTVSSYDISVKGGSPATEVTVQSAKAQSVKTDIDSQDKKSSVSVVEPNKLEIWMLLVSFIAGVLATLLLSKILPLLSWSSSKNPMKESQALKILYPHINHDPQAEEMVRKLYAKRGGDKSVVIDKVELKRLVMTYKEN